MLTPEMLNLESITIFPSKVARQSIAKRPGKGIIPCLQGEGGCCSQPGKLSL
jgi:hypothetical protein